MSDYLNLYIDCEDFNLNEVTLEKLTEKYGLLDDVTRDLKVIEEEILSLIKLKEEYVKIKYDIESKINELSSLESKYILKIVEHPKRDKYDYYSLDLEVLKVSLDNKTLINREQKIELAFSERGKVLNDYIEKFVNEYPNIEIYSNKELKNYKYKLLLELNK